MKEKLFMGFTVICLIGFCWWGISNDTETQTETHTKVVHETVTVYY